ncbi:MAG TPA: DUF305 domain-containing protein [Candidatus Levybacteria bacterium]|nr:DUF305 domain-containing protein [Candidatus Levybacteria bacterium]
MKNDKFKYGLGGILIGTILVWLTTMTIVNSNNVGMMEMMGYRNGNQTGVMQNSNSIDAHFIEQMIPHHEDAITMAKLAQTKAQRPEVKELANNIIDSQGKEINQMKDWYKTWFGKEVPQDNQVMNQHGMMGTSNSTHMGMMGDASDMTNLEKSTDFDRAFVEEMIPHHQMAVMMASMLKNGTERPEMKKLADDIIAAQTKEIDQMRQWLKNWQ